MHMAERVGFEPSERLRAQRFSRPRSKALSSKGEGANRGGQRLSPSSRESHDQGANNAGCEPGLWTYFRGTRS
jgi:hypothetical protein